MARRFPALILCVLLAGCTAKQHRQSADKAGCDGLFIETHPDPPRAPSDGTNMLPLDRLPALIDDVLRIRAALGAGEATT